MKVLFINYICLLIVNNLFGQCNPNEFFSEKFGLNKFYAINALHSNKYVYDVHEGKTDWLNYEYLKGDSVNYKQVHYKYKPNRCIRSERNFATLCFADDKLFKWYVGIHFDPSDYNTCYENYMSIVESMKSSFIYFSTNIWTDKNTKEQVGESYEFSNFEEDNDWNNKITVEVSLNLEYDTRYDYKGNDTYRRITDKGTRYVSEYYISIVYVDFSQTKLNPSGSGSTRTSW